jgi:3-methylcrotonyl-CoA carboxylase alpha subunit
MIKNLLIANRGEIACRIIRAAKKLGIRTIAIFSEADKNAVHRWSADEAYCIGDAPVKESYLNQEKIIAMALAHQADAIHPGYGFLSENPVFAQKCLDNQLIWVGPPPAAMTAMGVKDEAKRLMEKAGVPIIPGFHQETSDTTLLYQKAKEIGFPLLIKACYGGGGKGMRLVHSEETLQDAIDGAMREARSAFGEPAVFIEKYLENARHIEVQILGDTQGNIVHLWDRDCSLQRRHQKIIETAPAHHIPEPVRAALHAAAIKAAKSLNYYNAGTIEFLLDKNNDFYFLEMNTRLQVEHPVTEIITGIDLVEAQLNVASGLPLPFTQDQIPCQGFAAEARLYAEDPYHDFLPTTGKITTLVIPDLPFFRFDSGIKAHDVVSVFYDPLLAKMVVKGETREQSLQRLETVLHQTVIFGLTTNLPFLRQLLNQSKIKLGAYHTKTIETNPQWCKLNPDTDDLIAIATVIALKTRQKTYQQHPLAQIEPNSPWWHCNAWSLTQAKELCCFELNGKEYKIPIFHYPHNTRIHCNDNFFDVKHIETHAHQMTITLNSHNYECIVYSSDYNTDFIYRGQHYHLRLIKENLFENTQSAQPEGACKAPMPGIITQVFVKAGDAFSKGDKLIAIEAMKMEHTLAAPDNGVVKAIPYAVGKQVSEGELLLEVEYTHG